mgnify:FL=1
MEFPDSKRGVLVKTTLVDFPGRVACAFFFAGCNLRCPYCYNRGLVLGEPQDDYVTIPQLIQHLEKRKNVLSGLVLSGGEALLQPELPALIAHAKKTGYAVKLDTNGMLPHRLQELISAPQTTPDYIALDVKTSPERYCELHFCPQSEGTAKHASAVAKNLLKSIEILSALPPERREFRTVLVPPLVSAHELEKIARCLPKNAAWFLSSFRNENCVNPAYEKILPYSPAEEAELLCLAKGIVSAAALR